MSRHGLIPKFNIFSLTKSLKSDQKSVISIVIVFIDMLHVLSS